MAVLKMMSCIWVFHAQKKLGLAVSVSVTLCFSPGNVKLSSSAMDLQVWGQFKFM